MRKMRKRILPVIMVLGMALGLFHGAALMAEEERYPIVDEPIEMTMFRVSMPNVIDFETNDFTKYMEELTNIHWTFKTANNDNADMQINLEMSSGSMPDLFLFGTPDVARYGVKDQLLLPLNELIEPNMPNLQAFLDENPQIAVQLPQTDGNIYGVPGINQCYHCSYRNKMWVNTKHLEELGMEMPETTEELKEVLAAYLEANPTGIGFGGSIDGWGQQFYDWLTNSFLLDPGTSSCKLVLSPEGKIETIATKDEYRDALRFMRDLYEMGAIYEGSLTQNNEQYRALMNEAGDPVLFAPYGTISDAYDASSNPESYAAYRVIPPVEGPNGARYATHFENDGVIENAAVLTTTNEHPEETLQWLDYFYTLKGYLSMQFGANEGEDWVLDPGEDKLGLNGEPALYEILNQYSSDPQNHDWQDVGLNFATNEIRLGQATDTDVAIDAPEGLEKLLFVETQEKMEPYAQGEGDYTVVPSLHFTADESDAIQLQTEEIKNHIEQGRLGFIMGTMDIDSDDEWQAYVDAFDTYGLPQYLEVMQTAYDRQAGE